MKEMTIEQIQSDYDAGYYTAKYPHNKKYDVNHVIDEDKSVRWNKEEVTRLNLIRSESVNVYRNKKHELTGNMINDIVEYIKTWHNLLEYQARIIVERLYTEHHSDMNCFFNSIDEECEYIISIMHPIVECK